MPNDFQYDVFLSHSAKDKAVVRLLAEWLRVAVRQHSRAWFGELKPSASVQSFLHPSDVSCLDP